MPELDPEDTKIVTLALSALARTGAPEGAAVRDTDGRTYIGVTVSLPSLKLTALQAAVAAAVASGATGLEAAAVVSSGTVSSGTVSSGTVSSGTVSSGTVSSGTVSSGTVDPASLAAVRELGPTAPVLLIDQRGEVHGVLHPAG